MRSAAIPPDSHGIRARAHLIERSSSYGRWRMHDLVRLYATQLEDERADQDGRTEAMERLRSTAWPSPVPLSLTWILPLPTRPIKDSPNGNRRCGDSMSNCPI